MSNSRYNMTGLLETWSNIEGEHCNAFFYEQKANRQLKFIANLWKYIDLKSCHGSRFGRVMQCRIVPIVREKCYDLGGTWPSFLQLRSRNPLPVRTDQEAPGWTPIWKADGNISRMNFAQYKNENGLSLSVPCVVLVLEASKVSESSS